MRRRLLIALLALGLALPLVAGIGFLLLSRSGLAQRSGEARLAGLSAAVTVRFDGRGVPHLAAASGRDLAIALGWLHANDRLFQMELGRRAAAGRLSELFGPRTLEVDGELLTLRLRATAERGLGVLSPESRAWLEAYAEGVNAWLAARGDDLPPEFRLLRHRPEPWQPADSLSFVLLMARDLSFWDDRPEEERFGWLRAFGPATAAALIDEFGAEVPPAIAELAQRADAPSARQQTERGPAESAPGSNNWLVDATGSASGAPLVANDPHLALRLPSVWYLAHLVSPEYEAAGVTLPGMPGVVIGRGPEVAWALTNVMLDDHDLFLEELDEGGTRVRRGDGWAEIRRTSVTIAVAGRAPESFELLDTDRGPLLPADRERGLPARSLAWTAHQPGDPIAALAGLARARSVAEVPAAVAPYVAPAQNLLAADRQGGVVQTIVGRAPLRRQGDGRFPLPGWDLAYGWEGLRPAGDNPRRLASRHGYLWTANDDSWGAERPAWLAGDFDLPARADRIRERLEGGAAWTAARLAEVQLDERSLYARQIVALLAPDFESAAAPGLPGEAREAYRALAAWDGAMALGGPAALFALAERELRRGIFGDEAKRERLEPFDSREALLGVLSGRVDAAFFDDVATPAPEARGEIVARALASAWREGQRRWGGDPARWDYGALHTLDLAHPLGALPLVGRWFHRGPWPMPGSATTVNAFGGPWRGDRQRVSYGPSMRWVTDLGAADSTLAILPGGQAGHPGDPYYDDQLPIYLAGRSLPLAWSEAEVARATVSTLRLVPASKEAE